MEKSVNVSIPDQQELWERCTIQECIGTPEEHEDVFYVHDGWGIEEHDDGSYEVYAIVHGNPIKCSCEPKMSFQECTEFIRASLESKAINTSDSEEDNSESSVEEESAEENTEDKADEEITNEESVSEIESEVATSTESEPSPDAETVSEPETEPETEESVEEVTEAEPDSDKKDEEDDIPAGIKRSFSDMLKEWGDYQNGDKGSPVTHSITRNQKYNSSSMPFKTTIGEGSDDDIFKDNLTPDKSEGKSEKVTPKHPDEIKSIADMIADARAGTTRP